MDPSITDALRRAYEYLKAGNKQDAQPLLVEILKRDENNEQAWLLLSLVVTESKRQAYALKQVVRINPENQKAWERLSALTGEKKPDTAPAPSKDEFELKETPTKPPPKESPTLKMADDELLNQRLFGEPAPEAELESTLPAEQTENLQSSSQEEIEPAYFEEDDETPFEKSAPKGEKKPRKPINRRLVITLLGLLLLVLLLFAVFWAYTSGLIPAPSLALAQPSATAAMAETLTETLEPIATQTPTSPPPTSTPTPKATITPLPTATIAFSPLFGPALDEARNVQGQVQELSGLNLELEDGAGMPGIINFNQARDIAAGNARRVNLADMARIYTYLGLLDEGQTIENYFQNLGVESFGGMYAPEIDQVLIVGLTFGEKEQYVYVNEYVAYLADQEFDQEKVGLNSVCSEDMQACAALHALISGHAGMIAEDWLNAYASSETQDEIEAQLTNYKLFPQASDAGFINADLSFYREMGADFVAAISKNFGVAGIWDAYLAPPTTTEQILHPEKYLEIEEAIIVDDVEIFSEFESDGWQIARNDSLGEWLTYLILTENSSELAQLTQDDAADAAAGWGGDQYYFFKHPNSGDTVIAVHWVFDDEEELEEFYTFFAFYIAGRFSDGFPDIEPEADCYGKDRVTCFAVNEAANELIWIMGDEEADIDTLINDYLATFP